MPDGRARRRLLELYGQGLDLGLRDEGAVIAALEGTSPAFIRELLRRAALLAAEQGEGPLRVTDDHLHAALAELRDRGGELTQALLGARPPRAADDGVGAEADEDD